MHKITDGGKHLLAAAWANLRFGRPAGGLRVTVVVGANGKTTTTAFLGKIWEEAGLHYGLITPDFTQFDAEAQPTRDELRNPIALQRLLTQMKKRGVTEVAIAAPAETLQTHVLWGIDPEVVVLTNTAENAQLNSLWAKLFAKRPRFLVLNRDDERYDYFKRFLAGELKLTFGAHEEAECRITKVQLYRQGSDIELEIDHQTHLVFGTQLVGKLNVYNATAAAAAAYQQHVAIEHIQQGIESLTVVPGRLERLPLKKPYDVFIDDAQNPDALLGALEALKHVTKNRLILVLSTVGDRTTQPALAEAAAHYADRIVLTEGRVVDEATIGNHETLLRALEESSGAKTEEVTERDGALEKAASIARPGDIVVVEGMGAATERLVRGAAQPWNDREKMLALLQD